MKKSSTSTAYKMDVPKPYINSRVCRFINKRVDELSGKKTQREISVQAGFSTANMMSMLKGGDARVPLDRVPTLARALEVDPMFLMRLALEQFISDQETLSLLAGQFSENEVEIIGVIREASGDSDPGLNDRRKAALREAFAEV